MNEIFKRQGMEPLQATLHNITGLPIDYFLLVNFYGVERIIDALGGVNVWSPREFDERFVYLDTDEEIRLVLEPGSNTLNGREAVAYGRSRKYDPGGDFARICRQQQVMRGLREQALVTGADREHPRRASRKLGGAFRTDFPLEQLPALAELALRTPAQRVHSFAVHSRGGELLQWFTGEDGAFLLRPDLVAIRDFVADAFDAVAWKAPTNAAGEPVFIADNCEALLPELAFSGFYAGKVSGLAAAARTQQSMKRPAVARQAHVSGYLRFRRASPSSRSCTELAVNCGQLSKTAFWKYCRITPGSAPGAMIVPGAPVSSARLGPRGAKRQRAAELPRR